MSSGTHSDRIREIAVQCLWDEDLAVTLPVHDVGSVRLLGPNAICDSLGLVRYLVELEERVNTAFGSRIKLMDDNPVSQTRSPFRTLATLTDFITGLLKAEGRI